MTTVEIEDKVEALEKIVRASPTWESVTGTINHLLKLIELVRQLTENVRALENLTAAHIRNHDR